MTTTMTTATMTTVMTTMKQILRKNIIFAFIYERCFLFCKQEDSCTYPPDNYA